MPPGGEDAAQQFYEGLLGLPRVPKPPHLETRGGCWFESDTVKIHLGVEQPTDGPFHPARKAHPALLVDGLPALVEQLRAAGRAVRDDDPLEGYDRVCVDDPLEGYDRVCVDDPFGNRIELMEPHT